MEKSCLKFVLVLAALVMATGASPRMPRTPAVPDSAQVVPGGNILIDVLANDTPLGDGLQLERLVGVRLGEAVIEDGQVRYTAPATTSAPGTRFGYFVRQADGNLAVGVVDIRFLQPVELRLQGEVVNAAASCDFRAEAGGQVFEGCIDALGRFDLLLPDVDPQALVVLSGTAGRIDTGEVQQRFSLLGSAGELAELAGSDGILDAAAFSPLRITPYTTAQHATLATANGGEPVGDTDTFARLQASVDAAGVVNRTVVYEAVATGALPLQAPAGDAYGVIADRDTYDALIARFVGGEFPGFDFTVATLALLDTPANLSPWRGDSVPGVRVRVLGSTPGTIATGFTAGDIFELRGDGQARVVRSRPGDPSGEWSLDANGRIVFPVPPTLQESTGIFLSCQEAPFFREFTVLTQQRVTQLSRVVEGPGVDISTARIEQTVLNRDEAPEGCTSFNLADRSLVATFQDLPASATAGTTLPLPQGRVSVQVPFADFPDRAGLYDAAAIMDFDAGEIAFAGYLPQFQAEVLADGRLRLLLQREGGAGEVRLDAWRVRGDGSGGEQWLIDAVGDAGISRTRGTLSVPEVQPDLFDDPDTIVGRWLSGVDIAFAGTALQGITRLETEFDALEGDDTGLGRQRFVSSVVSLVPFRWSVVDGVVEKRFLRSRLRTGDFADCPEDDPEDCYLAQLRTWQPLLLTTTPDDKARLYVLESLQSFSADGAVQVQDRRNRFVELVLPD